MSTTLVRRPAKTPEPPIATEPITLATPPVIPEPTNPAMGMTMIAMPMMAGSSGLIMALTNIEKPLYAMVGLMMMVGAVTLGAVLFISIRLGPRRKLREQRERYLDYLDDMRSLIRDAVKAQQAANERRHPHPPLLSRMATEMSSRWERRLIEPDLLQVRCGIGKLPLSRTLSLKIDEDNPLTQYDPVSHSGANELVDRYARIGNQPLTVPLAECDNVSIVGQFQDGRRVLRAMLGQLVTLVSPDDAMVAVVRHPRLDTEWNWTHFLPHAMNERSGHTGLPAPLVCVNTDELSQLLHEDLAQRMEEWRRRRGGLPGPGTKHLIVVIDAEHMASVPSFGDEVVPQAELGIHIVALVDQESAEPEGVDARIQVSSEGELQLIRPKQLVPGSQDPLTESGDADSLGVAECAGIARAISPYRLAEGDGGEALHAVHGLTSILGVEDPATFDPHVTWAERPERDTLRAPFGVTADGATVELDLKESALGGMGPHGLIIGATGSGKSEALRTLVASLATRHSPEQLALLTVDFKGGATFADCDPLPHNAGSITNLADDLALVDRFREALFGEMMRRQQLLKDAGNLPNLHAYKKLRAQRPDLELEQLPHLLVIIDEFSELLTAKPDFSDLFLAIGRIGRSIGVHLLLATQRLESGQIRGLESHLSYRIGLRTFSEGESREAIGVPDAYRLPPEPGSGYLKVDTSIFTRFKAAMVSDEYVPPSQQDNTGLQIMEWPPPSLSLLNLVASMQPGSEDAGEENATKLTVLQTLIQRLSTVDAEPVRPVWLEPLPNALPLDEVPGGTDIADEDDTKVKAIFGLLDDPREQRQEALTWDMTGAESNLMVVGAPSSGKSMVIRALVSNLALRYSPEQVACYCVDYGGGALANLAQLPHVAAVATRAEPELTRRVLADIHTMLDEREALMYQHGLDSAARLRQAHRQGRLPSNVAADVVLIVDGWTALRENSIELDDQMRELATRGPALGVHVVLTSVTPTQIRTRLRAAFGGQLELRLTDPFDSSIDRKLSENLPKEVPGRVLCADELFGHVALPRIDSETGIDDLAAATERLAHEVASRWPTGQVAKVRTLPALVPLPDLVSSWKTGDTADALATRPILGVREKDLGPIAAPLDTDSHLIVYGDTQTGKSTALRTILQQLCRRPASEVGILLVDYRRAHLEEVAEEYLLQYVTSAPQASQNAKELSEALAKRIPGPEVTPRQLRDRSWWTGKEVYVVVDDYDLVASSNGNPLSPLINAIPQGRDLGFHLIVARRAGGASRAMHEKMLQTLSEQSPPGLLFSGDRMEGRLSNGVAFQRLPVGRAQLTQRGQAPELVQIALS